jgi:two-component system, cell cycle sensor histidine kinase and response regulator CckA
MSQSEPLSRDTELARLNRLYAALCQINQAIVRLTTAEELIARVCQVLVDAGGFKMAWVGWRDPATGALQPIARAGDDRRYVNSLRVFTDDTPEGRGPSGRAFRENRPYICNDILADPATLPWRAEQVNSGFRASAAFPISSDGAPAGVLSVYASVAGFFQDKEIALLRQAADDLSLGLEHLARDAERRRLDEAARSERLFTDTIIESMPGIVYFFNRDGRLLRWNRNFALVSGYSPSEIVSMHGREMFAPEDRTALAQAVAAAFTEGEAVVEASILTKDGRTIPHFLTARRVLLNGEPCLAGVGVDISERKRAEARLADSEREYRDLVQLANSIILRWDADGRIRFLNDFGQRLFGYSEDELLGRTLIDTIVPRRESGGRDLVQLMDRVLADPDAFEQNINENIRRSGERLWVAWTNRVVRNAQGEVSEILSVGTDVTERRSLEQQFLRTQRLESIGTLAGGIAHDLNNVLAPIVMGIDFLRMGESDRGRLDMLDTIESSARRGADMIRQVLGFARGVDVDRVEVNVGRLLRDMAKFADETFYKEIAVELTVPPDLWPVSGDPTQLHQVLMNLCLNARDAMPKGGTLRLSAANIVVDEEFAGRNLGLAPGSHVVVSIEDTGAGIQPDVLDRIFEPFFTTKDPGKGTGLGLPTSLAIVKSHGGFIRVDSEPDSGTTFEVYLPARAAGSAALEAPSDVTSLPRGNGQLIMVVDDEAPVREVTRRTLEAFGYRVVVAADAAEAVARFTELGDAVSVVLTDMMMPIMDGPSLIQALTRLSPGVRIIAVSGHLTEGRTVQAAGLGVRHFLLKPYTAEILLRELQQVLADS